MNLNRAVNEDIVCVEVLPEQDWTCPSSIVIDEEIKEEEAEESTTKQVWNSFKLALTSLECEKRPRSLFSTNFVHDLNLHRKMAMSLSTFYSALLDL